MCDQPEINVEVPPSYYCTLKAKPVSNEEKNEELSNMTETINKKSESLGTRDMSEMFKIEGDLNIDEEFKVTVKFDNDVSNQYLDFFAVVKSDNKWSEIPAKTKTTTMVLNSESDKIYQHEYDPKIMVEFQKGSVKNQTPIAITVLPVIPKQLETLKNDFGTSIIEDMSPIMIISQPGKSDFFNKPVRCTLPCKPLASSEKRKTLMVKLDLDGQADVFEEKTKDNDNGTCSFEAKRINMCSIVQTTQSISDDRYTKNKILYEVLYLVGEAKRCILQTFRHKKERLIRTEIIQISNKRKVQEKMEKEGFRMEGPSSKVITLRKRQRIRVDLTGRIQKLQTQKNFGLFVVFQPNLDTICMEFGFEIKKEMGTSLHGEITYSSDNFDKVVIDTVHFDPSKPSSARTSHRYSLSRERSALQDQQFVHRKSINPQGRGKSARPQTEKYAVCKNLKIQRSKTDVSPRANVSSPSQNAEMNMTSPFQTEDVIYIRTKRRN